jgi:hypothetical protein
MTGGSELGSPPGAPGDVIRGDVRVGHRTERTNEEMIEVNTII